MPSALVTGSAGFVGQRMIPALIERGFGDIVEIDIKNGHDARDFFHGLHHRSWDEFDLVVHLAAVVGGRATIEGDPLAVAVDLEIDSALFQWAVRTHQPHVLYFSSSAAYPIGLQMTEGVEPGRGPLLSETDIQLDRIETPDMTYGWAKLTGEMQAHYARLNGVKVTVARPFSGTGPTQALDYPLPAIVQRAVALENPIDVWSDSVRDFVHIDDLVDVALTAVELGIEEPFNIGTGVGVSFSQVAKLAAFSMGYEAEVRVLSDKPAGVAYRVADPTFMRSWYPKPLCTAEQIIAVMVQTAAVPA